MNITTTATTTKKEEEIKNFEERTGLPRIASQSKLEEIGARYLETKPFNLNGKTVKVEYYALQCQNGWLYFWKRIDPSETTDFTIHGEFYGKKYRLV